MAAVILEIEVDGKKPIHDDALIDCEGVLIDALEEWGFKNVKVTRKPKAYFGCLSAEAK